MIGHVFGHHRARSDHCESPDRERRNECCTGADGRAVAHVRAVPIRRARPRGARFSHVGEHRSRADEDVVAEDDAVPHSRVALNARSVTNDRARCDEREGADDDVRA